LGLTTELKEKLTLKNSVIMGASSEMFLKWEQTKSYKCMIQLHKRRIKTGVELAENVFEWWSITRGSNGKIYHV
jgi:hypothetical protein